MNPQAQNHRTKQQLIRENRQLRRRMAELEAVIPSGRQPSGSELAPGSCQSAIAHGHQDVEQVLRHSEQRYRLLFDRNPDGVFAVDTTGRFVLANPSCEVISGYSAAELLQKTFMELCEPDQLASTVAQFERSLVEQTHLEFETALIRKDGRRVALWVAGEPIVADGKLAAVHCTAKDITERKCGEEALRQTEERIREILASIQDAFYTVDRDWRIIYVNQKALDVLKKTNEEMIGRILWDVLPQARNSDSYRELQRAMRQQREIHYEAVSSVLDRWVEVHACPMARGGLLISFRDITDRTQAEEALRISEEKFAKAFHGNTAAMAITRMSDGLFIDVNDRWLQVTRFPREEVVGRKSGSQLNIWKNSEDRDRFVRDLRQQGMVRNEEFRFVREGGEEWTGLVSSQVSALGGEQVIISSIIDITERKRAEEALRNSERLYRAIGESIDYGVWVCDPDGRNTYASESFLKMVGISQEECSNFGWGAVLHPDDAARTIEAWKECVRTEGTWDIEHRFRGVDGKWHPVLARGVPVRSEDGAISCWAGINLDISRLKQTEAALREREAALREADRRKDEFLAMLAHELRNPLAAIYTAIELLKLHGPAAPVLDRARDAAARQSAHMARLLDDLLDVARVTQGKVTLNKQDVSLHSVVESAVEASHPFMNARKHRLYVSHTREPMHVHGDQVRLSQAIGNLLHNSAKYTPAGGEIYLVVEREGDQAIILVRDNGTGIDPELLPHIFELFVQGSRSPDRAEGGLGVGLTLVRSLVELHGGRVEARSEGLGKGSEFRVWLPLLPAVEEHRTDAMIGTMAGSRPCRILVVDDNMDTAELLSVLLEMEGHKVAVADSGVAAVDLALKFLPEAALVDIGMPGMDGYEVARRMRRAPELRHTALVAITGYGQQEDIQRSREAGFDYHLVKPVDTNELMQVLKKIGRIEEK